MKAKIKELLSLQYIAALGLFCLTLSLIVKTPISESFWLDESITGWLTKLDLSNLIKTSLHLQAQSPLGFVFFWGWSRLFGSSEIALRSLSILASFITLICTGYLGIWFSYSLWAEKHPLEHSHEKASKQHQGDKRSLSYLHPAALLPPIFLLSNENFLRLAWTARPYALGLTAFIGSLIMLTRWCSTKRQASLTSSLFLLVLAFYLHYLLVLGAIIHILIAYRSVKKDLSLTRIVITGVVMILAFTPGIYHIYCWSKYRDVWNFLPSLTLTSASLAFLPRQWFVYLPVALILTWISIFPKNPFNRINNIYPVVCWCLLPTASLILVSVIAQQSFLSNRYLLSRELGLAIMTTGLVLAISTSQGQRLFLAVWLMLCCGFELNRQWRIENWRQVAMHLNSLPSDMPVLLNSGLAELKSSTWIESVKDFSYADSYLSAPLKGYSVSQTVYPLAPSREDLSGVQLTGTSNNPYELKEVLIRIDQTLKRDTNKDLILVTNLQKKLTGADETVLLLKQLESFGFVPKIESDLDLIRIYYLKKL